jgi:hypothetical protein
MTLADLYGQLRNALMGRRDAYQITFRGPVAEKVLRDLARFCRAHESTANPNTHIAARLDGRREVWLRIQAHLKLSPDKLWELYSGRPTNPGRDSGNDSE